MNRFLLLFVIIFTGCQNYKQSNLKIMLSAMDMHLTRDERSDQQIPPQLYFEFSVSDLNNNVKPYFLSKKSSLSKAFIVDTVNNQVLPIILGSTVVKINNKASNIWGYLSIYDHEEYFGLDSVYFNRLDFSNEKDFLRKKCIDMLNRSTIIYLQESDDNTVNNNQAMIEDNCKKSVFISKQIYSIDDIKIR